MLKKLTLILAVIALIYACGGSSGGEGPVDVTDNFDRAAMLVHLADDIIIPAFEDFESKVVALETATNNFTTTTTETNLVAVQTAWLNAYKTWQYVEMFNIGEAENLQFVNFINIYPVTVTDIETNITNGSYDLDHPNNHDAQGFPALDYLLYGVGSDNTAVLEKYTTDTNASGYKTYITDIVTKIKSVTSAIVNDWNGTYRASFVSNSGNTATSSINKLINDYIFYFEKGLRANKIGIPAGVFSTDALPEKVEGFYNQDVSKELAIEALDAVEGFFNGKNYNSTTEELGLKAYLTYLENDDLVTSITNQITVARTNLNDLDINFYNQVVSDNTKMTKTYDELQRVVAFFKSDMLQALNISVDYVDADGD